LKEKVINPLEEGSKEGNTPVNDFNLIFCYINDLNESSCLTVQLKEGGILHLRLNMNRRPIEKNVAQAKDEKDSEKRVQRT